MNIGNINRKSPRKTVISPGAETKWFLKYMKFNKKKHDKYKIYAIDTYEQLNNRHFYGLTSEISKKEKIFNL